MTISCGSVDILAVGSISISSNPTIARIWLKPHLGGTYTDQGVSTNSVISGLLVGDYDIKLVKATYQDWITTSVSVTDGGTTIVDATLVLATGSASFTSTPSGAEIFIDSVDQSQVTPQTISGLTPVSHSYRLTKAGYVDATGSFSITGGSTTPVSATLYTVANITATSITATPTQNPCVEGTCTVNVSVTWTNTGETSGNFTPNITVDTIPISPAPFPEQALAGGASVTKYFVVSDLVGGVTHIICPSPN